MGDMSRRDAVKLAAGLAVGAGAAGAARGEAKPAGDPQLEAAIRNPYSFMFTEQVTFKTSTTEPHTFDLVITSGRNPHAPGVSGVRIRPGTVSVFRADADRDEFTRKGGVYWKCGKATGRFQFKQPGALVMAVRDLDGTVRCYSLMIDVRC